MALFKETITKGKSGPGYVHRRSLVWIGLALGCLILDRIIPDLFWEKYYYHGFYLWIRQAYDFLLGWLPFPMVYVLVIILIVRIGFWVRLRKKGFPWMLVNAVGGVAFLIFLFYLLWAFNYHQVSLSTRLGFQYDKVTPDDIRLEFERASEALMMSSLSLPDTMQSQEYIQSHHVTDHQLRLDVEESLKELGLPYRGNVRVRQIWPKGFLLRWNTAGIYIPQAFEGHVDGGLLSVQKPFTMAHEMAHGYGVTDEGTCNFIAWLACEQSDDPWEKFSGALTYWKYTAFEMPQDSIDHKMSSFPPVVLRAVKLIRENDKRYPDLFPKYRDAIYSTYLKHHGVKGGLRSYNEVVLMVQQYLKRKSVTTDPE